MTIQDEINIKTLINKLDLKGLENIIKYFDKKAELSEREQEYYCIATERWERIFLQNIKVLEVKQELIWEI